MSKIKIEKIIEEINELNSLDGKTLTERFLKYNEEYGEFSAEVCKLVGISHKPYDREHLVEEMADAMQNLLSEYLDICSKTDITINEVFDTILVKNKKWREKAPLYTKNNKQVPELDLKLETVEVKGGDIKVLTIKNCFYHGFLGKSRVILNWLISGKGQKFNDYLDNRVTYRT